MFLRCCTVLTRAALAMSIFFFRGDQWVIQPSGFREAVNVDVKDIFQQNICCTVI